MAGEDGNATADLIARAAADPGDVEAFQLVRLLLRAQDGRRTAGVGGDGRPGREPVRFRAAAGVAYPSTEIAGAELDEAGRAALTVAFMGLTGPSGVLPDHYSERVVQRRRARDMALGDFLDLFNHRSVSLFYRAWAKSRLPVRVEEAERPRGDPFSRALASLIGLGLEAQRDRAGLGDGGMLGLAGALGRRVRTPGALRRLVASLVELPVKVIEFQGRWIDIAPADRTRLAAPRPGVRTFSAVGVDAVSGAQAFDVQSRFRIRLGPMRLADFERFFDPDGPRARLEQAVREAVGPAIDFDLQLVLRHQDTPPLQTDNPTAPARLGQTTWLGRSPVARDRDEAVIPAAS